MTDTIESLKKKYIKQRQPSQMASNVTLKRNLQAEINKINAITQLLSSKDIHISEINRLECSLNVLVSLIQSVKNAQANSLN